MYENYWRKFVDIKIAEQYFYLYAVRSQFWQWIINGLCMISSFTGVVSWATSTLPPSQSIFIVLASQIISVLQPLYPYGQRLYAAQHMQREYAKLALTAEQILNGYLYGDVEEKTLLAVLEEIQNKDLDIESKFGSANLFPHKSGFHKQAEEKAMQYLNVHFNLGE